MDASGAFLASSVDPKKTPLAVLEAEIARLEKIVAIDADISRRLTAVTKRIADETAALESLKQKLEDCKGARQRAEGLVAERTQSYTRVFDAILAEEQVLTELYAPLMQRLRASGGTLAKLSFTVRRVADVEAWAKYGEDKLFDLRTGPFKGIGSQSWRTTYCGQAGRPAIRQLSRGRWRGFVTRIRTHCWKRRRTHAQIRTLVCNILEGGELAFRDRARRLRIAFKR